MRRIITHRIELSLPVDRWPAAHRTSSKMQGGGGETTPTLPPNNLDSVRALLPDRDRHLLE